MTTTAGGGPSSASTEKLAGAGSAQALAAAQSLGKPVESTQPGGEVATSVGSGAPASSASEAGAAKREPPASAPGAQGPAVAAEQQASQGEQQGAAPTGPWSKRKRIGEMEISSGVNQNQFPLLHQHILRRKESHNATEQKRRQVRTRPRAVVQNPQDMLPDRKERAHCQTGAQGTLHLCSFLPQRWRSLAEHDGCVFRRG
jgi:hypothetical protein